MRVSIGIPFLNAESTLAEAIRSVFAQTYGDWELMMVDDGSSDRSLEIAMSVDDPRVRVVSDGANRGLSARLNEIARASRGEYCARMDADDIMHPDRLARQVEYMDSHPAADIVGTAVYMIDAGGAPVGVRHTDGISFTPASVVASGFICHPTAFMRTEWCVRNSYDEALPAAEDHELYCRTAPNSTFARLSEPLLYYREAHKDPVSFLHAYGRHCEAMRRCYRRYGPTTVGWPATIRLILRSHVKTGVYALATVLGAQEAVIKRRHGRPLTDEETQEAGRGLQAVAATRVPGMDTSIRDQQTAAEVRAE